MLLSRDETEGEKKDDECWEVGGSSFASLAAWCHKCRPYSLRPENNDKGFQQRRKPLSLFSLVYVCLQIRINLALCVTPLDL
jgi:hypothetical protein